MPLTSSGHVLPPRDHRGIDSHVLPLSGTWQFCFHPIANPEGAGGGLPQAARIDGDLSAFVDVTVPSHWVLDPEQRFGHPAYTNVQLPIPLTPPYVPDDNPTGDYRRTFHLPEDWPRSGRHLIRLLGAESSADVFVNEAHLGTALGSRLTHEFDATEALRPGENVIAIRIRKYSPGTYVEDQDQWWLPGLFREVDLIHQPAHAPFDVITDTDWDGTHGLLTIAASDTDGQDVAGNVTVSIGELGFQADVALGSSVRISGIRPWNPDDPRLYTVRVVGDGWECERRLGFRRIEIRDGVLLANGEPLVLHGVNRHETHRRLGRVFDEEWVRADLDLMKTLNINAIRTAHYPPHPRVLELADEIGLWVMVEADYETHAFEAVGWENNPSDDPAWSDVVLDRVQRTVLRDRSHACIFSWSLGNESHTGANLAAAAEWLRSVDPSRPMHYEGDRALRYTDLYSRMYPAFEEVDAALNGTGLPIAGAHHPASRIEADDADRIRTMPFLMCEYGHAMGTGPGALDGYVKAMTHPRHCGGFIWEWRDHAIEIDTPTGTALRYGGDFGEPVHDGNFVCDGMVDAYSTPSAGLIAWANLIAPVTATYVDDAIQLDTPWLLAERTGLELCWQVRAGRRTIQGHRELDTLAPRRQVRLHCPDLASALAQLTGEGDVVVTLAVIDPATEGISTTPVTEVTDGEAIGTAGSAHPRGRIISVRSVELDGTPVPRPSLPATDRTLAEVGFTLPEVTLWRAPTDNDEGHGALDYWPADPADTLGAGGGARGLSSAERWRFARLDKPSTTTLKHTVDPDGTEYIQRRTGFASQAFAIDAHITRTPRPVGATLTYELTPTGEGWPRYIPRQGVRFTLPGTDWQVTYDGMGPTENYADLMAGARRGVFSAAGTDLHSRLIKPQEASHRSAVRWIEFCRDDVTLRLDVALSGVPGAAHPGVSVCPWPPEVLEAYAHDDELPEPDSLTVIIDAIHHGVGSRSCGPDVRPEYAAQPIACTLVIDAQLS